MRCSRCFAVALAIAVPLVGGGGFAHAQQGSCAAVPSPAWRPRLEFPHDHFQAEGGRLASWVKFTILNCDRTTVFFQNSVRYPFHYDFASETLGPFLDLGRDEFERRTLHADRQEAVLGAVILPSWRRTTPLPQELGVQLIREDPYEPDEVIELFRRVVESVDAPEGVRAFYFPTALQRAAAHENAATLLAAGIEISSPDRWADDDTVYAEGWALGRLKYFSSDEIDAAYRDGRLSAADVLVTDAMPSDVPFVAGLITEAPSSPNSHVAILAREFGVPFAHCVDEAGRQAATALIGRTVLLRAYEDSSRPDVRLVDMEGRVDPATLEEVLTLKALPPLDLEATASAGVFAMPVRGLRPADVRYVGGKAAGYGVLLDAVPEHTREAAALTFDLWDAFLDQTLDGGSSLREEIGIRLAPFRSYPPDDLPGLLDTLDGIRDLIKDEETTTFPPPARQAVTSALLDPRYGFDPSRKLRFRSSTNVEDTDWFTGAGLYDSRSGCLADDLDGDVEGPSACDPQRADERGVFVAIRRVYASFYNDTAYLERLRWGVDESRVGMAVLVHHSFPDETELANGVAILTGGSSSWSGLIVSQAGAVSVSNPQDGSRPEEVGVEVARSTRARLLRPSSRLRLGRTVLAWDVDYRSLAELMARAAERHLELTGRPTGRFDIEFKKTAPDGALVVKQIRRLPLADDSASVTPYLLNEPIVIDTLQGEASDVFANHRLKSAWTLETRSMWLTPENVDAGIYSRLDGRLPDGCIVFQRAGDPASFPQAEHSYDGSTLLDGWVEAEVANPRRYTLETRLVPTSVTASQCPVLTQRDFGERWLHASYASDVLGQTVSLDLEPRREESVWLFPRAAESADDILQERTFEADGIAIESTFYWPDGTDAVPREPVDAFENAFEGWKTAPLLRWVETRIEGLTSRPITLRDPFAQSYRPQHHNMGENYIFAPHLDPEVPADLLAELDASGVHLVYVFDRSDRTDIRLMSAEEIGHLCVCEGRLRGDVNQDDRIDLSDAVFLLDLLFSGRGAPAAVDRRSDINGDGGVDISDPIYLLRYLFLGGPAPSSDCDE